MNPVLFAVFFAALSAVCAPSAGAVEYVAHQGEEGIAPNHSAAAYRLAVEHGLDWLKLDVRETKDGEVILQHDATLKAVMGWDAKIRSLTLAEIREKGRCRARGGYTNETAVTLREALEIAKGMKRGVWIDFKDFSPALADKVFGMIDAAGYPSDRVKVATFSKKALRWVQKNHPAVRRVAHTYIRRLEDGGFQTNAAEDSAVVCRDFEALCEALEAHARDFGLHGFNMPHIVRNGSSLYHTPPALVRRLKKSGYWISIWFANEAATAEYYREAGADAFVTNWKARTFPGFDPARTERAALMRLAARIPDVVKDASSGRRAQALYLVTWEPDLAVSALEKSGRKPATAEEAFEILAANPPPVPPGRKIAKPDAATPPKAEAKPPAQSVGANVALGAKCVFEPAPKYRLTRDKEDADQLTDGVYVDAKPIWLSRKCVGWGTKDGTTVSVTLDLGEDMPIEGFSWNTAFGNGGTKFPKFIEVYVSVDGENWGHVGDLLAKATLERVMPPPGSYHVYRAWSRKMPCHGRYVKFLVLQMTFCFCDEIEVYRGDDSLLSLKPPSVTTKDPLRDNLAFMCRSRLMRDAERAGAPDETVAKIGEASKDAVANGFRTVVPFNAVHEEILAANAKRLKAAGFLKPAFWTNCRWDNLDPLAVPETAAKKVSVDMIRGEVRSATVNILNPGSAPLDCTMSVEGFGADTPVEPMEVLFTDTKHFRCVSGALRGGDGARLSFRLPAGISKQVWLKVNRPKGAAGVRKGRVVAKLSDGTSLAVPLEVRVRNYDMPRDPVLRTGGWDYLNNGAKHYSAPGNVQSTLRLHKELGTTPCATRAAAPKGAEFDSDGRLVSKLDFASFDEWVAMRPGCADYMIFMAAKDSFCGEKAGTPRFDRMVQEYYRAWVAHMHEIGIGGSRLVLHMMDEPYRVDQAEAFIKWGRPLRALGLKELRVYENPMCDPKILPREFFDLVDIVCPLDIWCLPEKYRSFYEKLAASGKEVWVYSTRGPSRTLCPIGYYRLRGWLAFSIGSPISASLFWAYGAGGYGPAQSWAAYSQRGVEYSPYFVGNREVLDAKQSEAVRESAEDFEYLRLLAAATSSAHAHDVCMKAMASVSSKKEDADWDSPRDREVLDAARIAILDELDSLAKRK